MNSVDLKHYDLRVNLDLLLRYGDLAPTVARVIRRLTHDDRHPTVVHVHVNVEVPQRDLSDELVSLYKMVDVVVGLQDRTHNAMVLFNTTIAERYLTDSCDKPLRRLDIHYNEVNSQTKSETRP